jgi:hypothetical protein
MMAMTAVVIRRNGGASGAIAGFYRPLSPLLGAGVGGAMRWF